MQSITVQSHVGEDGILRLQIPVGVKDADLKVTINYQLPDSNGEVKSSEELSIDESEATLQSNGWPPGYMKKVIGSWQGEFPEIDLATHDPEALAQANGWPPGFFDEVCGSLKDFPEIEYEGDYEIREEFR